MGSMNEWNDEKENISVEDMTRFVKQMRELHDVYQEASKLKAETYERYKAAEAKVLNALQATGLQKYNVPGLGTASMKKMYKITVPKDIDSKRKLFEYIETHYGNEVLDEYRSINYQTLNAFYNKEAEIYEQQGKDFQLPGVDEPTLELSVTFRKDGGTDN